MRGASFFMFFFPQIGSAGASAGYGVGGPTVMDAFPITGVAGAPTPVQNLTRRTH